jgi:hypothetical protein
MGKKFFISLPKGYDSPSCRRFSITSRTWSIPTFKTRVPILPYENSLGLENQPECPHMPADPGRTLKSFQRSFYVTRTCQPPKFTWEKSAMPRRYAGLTFYMGIIPSIRAKVLPASAGPYQKRPYQDG